MEELTPSSGRWFSCCFEVICLDEKKDWYPDENDNAALRWHMNKAAYSQLDTCQWLAGWRLCADVYKLFLSYDGAAEICT